MLSLITTILTSSRTNTGILQIDRRVINFSLREREKSAYYDNQQKWRETIQNMPPPPPSLTFGL